MNKKKKIILYSIAITLISIFLSVIIVKLVKDPQTYIDTINKKHLPTVISYILLSITQTIIPIIPGEPIELLAGYLFGKVYGTIICFVCESLASIFVVLISRKYGKRLLSYLIEDKKIQTIEKLESKKAFGLFSLLFIIPGTPKDLLCYFSGLAEYDIIPLLIVVTVGRIPSIISSTISAGFFQEEKYLISILIYLATVLICFIDILIYKKLTKNKNN